MNPIPECSSRRASRPSRLLTIAFVMVGALALAMCLLVLLSALGLPYFGAGPSIVPTPIHVP